MKKTYKIKALPASNNFIETILTQEEIDNYKKGGYFVEELETYQSGGETVSQTWERMTGLPWSEARKLGLTDGSRQKNLDLVNKLKAGLVTLPPNAQSIVTTPRVSTTSKPTAVEKNKVLVIKNASTFKEAFSIARKQLGPNHIFEWNGRKYGTNLEGETFEPSEEVLKNAKMSSPQVKVRLNVQNQNLDSPYINKRTVKLEDDRFEKWEHIKLRNAEINKNDNANKIIEYKKNNPGTQNFVIVDKEKGLMHLYKPDGTLLFTEGFKVDVGANAGDAQTVTKYKDLNNNGITDANEIFRSNIDWSMGNKSTGAGKFYISNIDRKGYGGLPILNMMNERQYENFLETGKVANVSTSFHKGYVEDNKTKVSNGCIRCNKTTLDNLSRYLKNSSEVYILPEDDRNKFVIENNKLNFRTGSNKDFYILEDVKNKVYRRDDPNSLNSWSVATPKGKFQKITDQNKIDKLNEKAVAAGNEYYIDGYENLQKGQGINRTVSTLASYPIKLDLDEETFKNDAYQWYDFNDDEEFRNVRSFIRGLEDKKSDIMKAAKINGDVYNEIAKMAFGIFGAESNYADEHTGLTNFLKAANKAISSGPTSSPDIISKYETYGEGSDFGRWINEMDEVTQAHRSTGYTQLRWNDLNDKEKEALRQVGITSYKDFLNPQSAATATAVVLGVRYNEQLTPEEKEDMWSYLPLKWNSNPEYPDRVLNNSRYVTVLQSKDKEIPKKKPQEVLRENPINITEKSIEDAKSKTKDPVYLESIVPVSESTTRVAPITPDPDTLKWLEESSGYKIKNQPQKAAQKAAPNKEQLQKINFDIQSKYGILPGDNPIRNYEQLQDQKYIYDFSEFPSLQKGGYIDAELDDEEIESYRKAGYGIEVITDGSIPKFLKNKNY